MGTHSLAEAKKNLPSLVQQALAGEEIVITLDGRPVAVLRALDAVPVPVRSDTVSWLRSCRVGPARELAAGDFLGQMRDEE